MSELKTLDLLDVRLRTFNIRLGSAERMIEIASRIAAQPGRNGKDGAQGPVGPQGPQGPVGPPPAHRWEGTKLQFEQPSGEWGEAVDLRGPAGETKVYGGVVQQATSSWEPSGW